MSKKPKKKRKVWKIVMFSILGLIAAVIFTAVSVGAYFYFSIKSFDPASISQPREKFVLPVVPAPDIVEYNGESYKYNDDIINVLFIGTDKKSEEVAGIVAQGGQADVLILLSINTKDRTYSLFNILRDSMTEISVYDVGGNFVRNEIAQIALAHHYGDAGNFSAQLTEQAAANLLYGIKIYRYIRLDVDGLVAATDLFGGVTVTLDEDAQILKKDYSAGEKLTLNGEQVENYLRNRDISVLTSSMERSGRQMRFLKSLVPQVSSKVKGDPLSVLNIYSQLGKYVSTNMTVPELTYIIEVLIESGFNIDDILSLPGEMQQGEIFAEFIVDRTELYDIIINNYYYIIDKEK